jgi:hypothetical protein
MCKVIRGERASYFIAGAISNSASPFSKTISAFNIFRAGASEGEKYSIAARGAFKAEQEGGCVLPENTRKERELQCEICHTAILQMLRWKIDKTKRTCGGTEPRGNNGSNVEITLADEENNNKTMPRSPCF